MKLNNFFLITLSAVLIVATASLYYWSTRPIENKKTITQSTNTKKAGTNIYPADFVATIDNPYFTLKPGATFTYQKKSDQEIERKEVVVTNEKKTILGVAMTVVHDRVWIDDELHEDVKDWYAQDKNGDVWYFGEAVDYYEDGKLRDHEGSWEAGVDGAEAGIIMKAHPVVGDSFRQEYYPGVSEDMVDIVALNKTITVPAGSYTGCLQVRDWSRIDATANEYKYYCPPAGFVVLETLVEDEEDKTELVQVSI